MTPIRIIQATRFPRDSLSGLKHLLGVKYHPPNLEFYKQISQAVTRRSERNTVLFERPSTNRDSERWSVEELIAMELAYVRELAREASGGDVNEVIVTVPGWFSQDQRLSMLDAIEIAGMKSVGLINDGSAVAINYAMTRSFPDKEYHIIYDAGAGSVRATLASFHSPHAKSDDGKKKKVSRSIKTPTKESVEIEILAVGYDQRASGNELTRRLRDSLVKKFEEKHGSGIVEDGRAMARLWKEAERVKSILSANADASTTVSLIGWYINPTDVLTKLELSLGRVPLQRY
jgi:hypoxia up-regulated 1